MVLLLILVAVVIFSCIGLNNVSTKMGIPMLLAFILLGIAFGNNGLVPIRFEDYSFAEDICTVALIFIMFYGGFGTRWQSARSVALEAGLMASVGVLLTAGLIGLFCHFVLGWEWIESFLMGSVVSSTDAASVFSILRSRKLGLKNNTAPLLEVESGSNDPCSYMLTVIMLSLLNGQASGGQIVWMVFAQLVFGAGLGILIAKAAVWLMRRIHFSTSGFDSLFMFAVAIFAYAVPSLVGGNGYLSAYLAGIILGNTDFQGKKTLVHFFDGITSLMQVLIFFLLGLLARPALLHRAVLPALAILVFMTVVARPASVFAILKPFGKYPFRQRTLVSFVGLRGAASIVFAIMATVGEETLLQHDLFNIVFVIVLLSIGVQGSLIPLVSRKLDMIDSGQDVLKTFNDYTEDTDVQFSQIRITEDSPWNGRQIKDLGLPKGLIIALIIREGHFVVPHGATCLQPADLLVCGNKAFQDAQIIQLVEHRLNANSKWVGHRIEEYPEGRNELVVLIKRGGENLIPRGSTVLQADDVLVINRLPEEIHDIEG